MDSRLISYATATKLNTALTLRASSLVYPWQNLIDILWKDRPMRPKAPVYIQPPEFTGEDAAAKLSAVRKWIRGATPETGVYTTRPPTSAQKPVATFLFGLASIAWVLNLRGADVPFNPVFLAYLFVALDRAILFIDVAKVSEEVAAYLRDIGVGLREYSDVWAFLRSRDWGEGKVRSIPLPCAVCGAEPPQVLISKDTPYTVPRSLTSLRYTISPAFVEQQKARKNDTEIAGFERAYLRDGAAMVRWYAWLDEKIAHGFEINEYEAAQRLTEFRRRTELYEGPAYEAISAAGPNAGAPSPPALGLNVDFLPL